MLSKYKEAIADLISQTLKERGVGGLSKDQGYDKYLWDASTYIHQYESTFKSLFRESSELNILDFGCGPAFSVYVGRHLGHNVRGLDVNLDSLEIDKVISSIHKSLQITNFIDFYQGFGELPYSNNSQDVIMSNWSILGDYSLTSGLTSWLSPDMGSEEEMRLKNRILELIRVSKEESQWVIQPKKHWSLVSNFFEESNSKNIKLTII
jgi:SAM-dependent methyltransferase